MTDTNNGRSSMPIHPRLLQKTIYTINGESPGLIIHAKQGDKVVVETKNYLLTENVVIHWHGIQQRGTIWSDGVEGVIRCPIMPGDTFTYKFLVDKSLLINGRGRFNCALLDFSVCNATTPECVPYPLTAVPGQTYRLKDWQLVFTLSYGL
ncbi:L-ascorbate oxidase [Morella rubra]|uniref:L-ascorbate oxidase n=1 Tax=Morella rubra TaxID=262757 RepID=A0A6A1UP58_9ROSI|nr:L-ascorbate oxidase [Morella rubra]